MPTTSPLQVLIVRDPLDEEVTPYEDAILQALEGGNASVRYVDAAEDLGIQIRRFAATPTEPAAVLLDACCHSLVVVLADSGLVGTHEQQLWSWVGDAWTHARQSSGRHGVIILPLEERLSRRIVAREARIESLQVNAASLLGEAGLRPAMFALQVLHESRVLLTRAVPRGEGSESDRAHLRLFISHAKADGLPLAHSLKHQIATIPWLKDFYDAEDLPAGCDWQEELERGVGASLVLMLRSDVYDQRYWCQQEVKWADEYAVPAVMIDARVRLDLPPSALPFARVPTVRIPDGNLLRVLHAALREGLRFALFRRKVEEMRRSGRFVSGAELRVFSFAPSMAALLRVCRQLKIETPKGTACIIVYPDPPLSAGEYEAAGLLVSSYLPDGVLTTPQTLAASKIGGPS